MERERLDVMHTMLKTAREPQHKLVHAAVVEGIEQKHTPSGRRPRVMDLGCGTGVWLLEMAEEYPHVDFHGYDVNRLAPSQLLSNIEIHCPVDIEGPWTGIPLDWDIIHLQLGLGAIKDWDTIYKQIRKHLKPGGWFEGVEIDWEPRSESSFPQGSKLLDWWKDLSLGYQWLGFPINYSSTTGEALNNIGFRQIGCQEYQIPLSGWNSTSARLHRSGIWCNIAMSAGTDKNHGMEAMSLRLFTKINGWPARDVQRFSDDVMTEASENNLKAYFRLFVWTARAPHMNEMTPSELAEYQGG